MGIKAKLALLKRWGRMLTGKSAVAVHQGPGKLYSKKSIEGYYNDLTGKIGAGTLLDDDGIPLTQLADNTKVYFPIAIFQYGLGMYDLYLESHAEDYLTSVRKIADWAVQVQNDAGAWDSFSPIKSKKYTVSSMCQGEGASLLFRAAKALNNDTYKNCAFKAIDFMLRDFEDGGTSIRENENLYLEEYPQIPRRSVLNGWFFSLFGLYDAAILKPEQYRATFMQSAMTMCKSLPSYDNGYWSMYDLCGVIASPAYHDVHISLLHTMADLTGLEPFNIAEQAFTKRQRNALYKFRAIVTKAIQKMKESPDTIVLQ